MQTPALSIEVKQHGTSFLVTLGGFAVAAILVGAAARLRLPALDRTT